MAKLEELLAVPLRNRSDDVLHTLIAHPGASLDDVGQCRAELDRRTRWHTVKVTALSAFLGAAVGAFLTMLLSD